MTQKVRVENTLEGGYTVVVTVFQERGHPEGGEPNVGKAEEYVLQPGEGVFIHLWQGRTIGVVELPSGVTKPRT